MLAYFMSGYLGGVFNRKCDVLYLKPLDTSIKNMKNMKINRQNLNRKKYLQKFKTMCQAGLLKAIEV